MTKFEMVGVGYQYDAASKAEANKSFQYSCACCCQKGMRIECDRCAIAHTHSLVIACFNDNEKNRNANK